MTDPIREQTQQLITRLREAGHEEQARIVEHTLGQTIGHGVLHALRDVCQTALTAIEAIDPVTEMALDGLRMEIDKRLMPQQKE